MRSSLALIVNNSILFPSFARPPHVLHQLLVPAYYRALLHTDQKKIKYFFLVIALTTLSMVSI
jgi:hypothetical protein